MPTKESSHFSGECQSIENKDKSGAVQGSEDILGKKKPQTGSYTNEALIAKKSVLKPQKDKVK